MSDLNNLKKRIDSMSTLINSIGYNGGAYFNANWIANNIFGGKSKIRKYKIKSIFK